MADVGSRLVKKMSAKGPRVSTVQRDMLIQFLEQHPYLGRSCTEVSPRMTAARKKQLWQEIATLLNQQGPAVKSPQLWRNHWAKMVYGARKELARSRSERK